MLKRTCLIVVGLWLFGMPAVTQARADECNGLDALGECEGLTTVKWCDAGVVLTVECPEGEICAQLKATGGGEGDPYSQGFHCVDKDKTPCKDIPPEGECTSGNTVVWCEGGKLANRQCTSSQTCAFDPEKGWKDCLRNDSAMADAGPDANYAETEDPEPEPPRAEVPDAGPTEDLSGQGSGDLEVQGPTPQVEKGEAYSADDPTGCNGGRGAAPTWWLLAALGALITLRRRRRTV